MSGTRSSPERQQVPSYQGNFVVDTVRGVLRIRKWPAKRGTSKNPKVLAQQKWFADSNTLAKFAASSQQVQAIHLTRNSGLYPRDLLLRAMAGKLIDGIIGADRVIKRGTIGVKPVAFQGCVLHLPANLAHPGGGSIVFPWGLPVLDTAGFWNAGQPTRLTIPAGVSLVSVNSSILQGPVAINTVINQLAKNGPFVISRNMSPTTGRPGATASTGILPVVAGDFFEVFVDTPVATTYFGGETNSFTIKIEGT